ncbi:hypothetical protein R1sor_007167 [Riccia sorocarpa]|uniref:Reverse transcriptase domain-containing protein n=1 Tax=Riccia sorocarpa TaxID=122646 RepID=A0ABD3HRX0_9MARC
MDDDTYIPTAKPLLVQISRVPLWAKEDLPKIFRKLGQVLQIPQESRELVKRAVKALILWNEGDRLPDSILVAMGERQVWCNVRALKRKLSEDDSSDSEVEDADPLPPPSKRETQGAALKPQTSNMETSTRTQTTDTTDQDERIRRAVEAIPQARGTTWIDPIAEALASRDNLPLQYSAHRSALGGHQNATAAPLPNTVPHSSSCPRVEAAAGSIDTPSWLKDSADQGAGCTDNEADSPLGSAPVQRGLTKSTPRTYRRTPPRQSLKNGPRGKVGKTTTRTIHSPPQCDDIRKDWRASSSKKRRFGQGEGETISEPSLELNLCTPGDHRISRRGVALLFKNEFQLLSSGHDDAGRFVWGRYQAGDKQIHVASIYAPNQTEDRIPFWDRLRLELPSANWFAMGDWNAVDTSVDSSSRTNVQSEEEAQFFQEMCNTLGMKDTRLWAEKTEGPRFSRAQFREGRFTWSRIDRIYSPDCQIVKGLLEEVREFQAWHHHRWRLTSRDKFIAEGDACTGYFFKKFRRRRARTQLTKLKTPDGVLQTNQADIRRSVQDNFTVLYSSHVQNHEEETAAADLLRDTHQKLSPEQKALLDDVPSEQEILESLFLLPTGKSPGIDGMGPEVMKLLWPVIGASYHRAVVHFWTSGALLPYFKEGVIFLLPKVQDPETIGQCRPITILNATYKVLAKILALRLALVLPTITPVEQHGFVKGMGLRTAYSPSV